MDRSKRPTSRQGLTKALAFAASLMTCCPAFSEQRSDTSLDAAAALVQADYRQSQWQRLAASNRRDDLIAALLIGTAGESRLALASAAETVEQRLADRFPDDPLAMFALALVCQAAGDACRNSGYHATLVRLAPDNTFHWLMSPSGIAFDATQLQQAAAAPESDSHASELTGIIRASLREPRQEQVPPDIRPEDLALTLRLDLADRVPHPDFAGLSALCRKPAEVHRADCIAVGRQLIADASGLVVSRMVGSAMLRRLMKGTPEAEAALELRREYVWLSDNWGSEEPQAREAMQADMVNVGEMAAWQRSLERSGLAPKPPVGWLPREPRHLLLHEDRIPSSEAK